MRKLPPLNAIRAFEAAARHESFTAAANELCVTVTGDQPPGPPAGSHPRLQTVRTLRPRRHADGRGHTIFPLLRDGFDHMASAFAAIRPPAGGDAITVSTTRAFAERWLMPRLPRFHAIFPAAVVHIDATEDAVTPGTEGIDLARFATAAPTAPA